MTFLPFMCMFANLGWLQSGLPGGALLGALPLEPPYSPVCLWGRGGSYPPLGVCLLLEERAWPLAPRVCSISGVRGSLLKALS